MNWIVPLADLDFDTSEENAVLDVLRSRWLTMGAVTKEFEQKFSELVGAKYAFAVSNATVALHMACEALGIGPGDEVIVPSLTFVATANAVHYAGGSVRFAEVVGEHELNISPEAIEAQITPATKAIIVVHYAGYPCRMAAIKKIADDHGLALIEDAAHAPGASLAGRPLGTWGDAGCFSFFSNKNLSTGEGGMLVTNRDDVADRVRLLRSHGMTSLTWDRHKGHAYSYDVVAQGYNYRIDEIRSALGLVQLRKLEQNNALRAKFTNQYWEGLSRTGVGLPFIDSIGSSAHHIFPILLPEGINRKTFIDSLREKGVQTSIHYPPVHGFTHYRERYGETSLPLTERIAAREVTLPLYPGMGADRVEYVLASVHEALSAQMKFQAE